MHHRRRVPIQIGDGHSLDTFFEQNIRWLDVAMHQALFMSGCQPGGDLCSNSECIFERQRPLRVDAFL